MAQVTNRKLLNLAKTNRFIQNSISILTPEVDKNWSKHGNPVP